MKQPLLFALGISVLSCGTMFAATAVKLLTLGSAVYDDRVRVFGVPISAIQNDAEGFSVEILPGMLLVSALLGALVFALITLSNRYLPQNNRY